MKLPLTTFQHFGASVAPHRGSAFALLSLSAFAALVALGRPHWALPWLLASMLTFCLWRVGPSAGERARVRVRPTASRGRARR